MACLLAALSTSNAQLQNPLLGAEGGNPPWAPALPGGPPSYTDVAVSALLERVTAFSTSENTYHAGMQLAPSHACPLTHRRLAPSARRPPV